MKKNQPVAGTLRGQAPSRRNRLRIPQWGPHGALMTAALLTAGALWFLSSAMPMPLILPVVSTLLLFGAALLAVIAWWRPVPDPRQPSYWDVTGAFTMAGIGAALLSEPEAVLPLLEAHWPADKTRN